MVYLHKSVFQSHGYLSSANCHVDSRWVLKISGFALHAFRQEDCKDQVTLLISFHITFAADVHVFETLTFVQKFYIVILLELSIILVLMVKHLLYLCCLLPWCVTDMWSMVR